MCRWYFPRGFMMGGMSMSDALDRVIATHFRAVWVL